MDAGQQIRKAVQAVSDGDIRVAMVIGSTGQRPSHGEAEVTLRVCSHRTDGGSIMCACAHTCIWVQIYMCDTGSIYSCRIMWRTEDNRVCHSTALSPCVLRKGLTLTGLELTLQARLTGQ